MTNGSAEDTRKHFLFPGTLHVDAGECVITTVLGSCVAVCLWDEAKGGGGMNHFMLPLWNGEGLATPKYGTIAMEKLLEQVLAAGCKKERLVAKVFGGANILNMSQATYPIGKRNVELALATLDDWRIKVVASDLEGTVGRKVIMNTKTGVVLMGRGKHRG
ncbi:MAG: chemotaxis protein CheD [Trichlorobacter sp.]|nr:chemotaxis protein CheD [Trichlorobacter sp.]